MVTRKSSEDNRTSILYWLLGGDFLWLHFKMCFLKQFAIYIVGIQIITILIIILFELQSIPFVVGVAIQTVQTILTILPFLSNNVSTYILNTDSTINDVKWLLMFISALSIALLIATFTGYVKFAGVQINGV